MLDQRVRAVGVALVLADVLHPAGRRSSRRRSGWPAAARRGRGRCAAPPAAPSRSDDCTEPGRSTSSSGPGSQRRAPAAARPAVPAPVHAAERPLGRRRAPRSGSRSPTSTSVAPAGCTRSACSARSCRRSTARDLRRARAAAPRTGGRRTRRLSSATPGQVRRLARRDLDPVGQPVPLGRRPRRSGTSRRSAPRRAARAPVQPGRRSALPEISSRSGSTPADSAAADRLQRGGDLHAGHALRCRRTASAPSSAARARRVAAVPRTAPAAAPRPAAPPGRRTAMTRQPVGAACARPRVGSVELAARPERRDQRHAARSVAVTGHLPATTSSDGAAVRAQRRGRRLRPAPSVTSPTSRAAAR